MKTKVTDFDHKTCELLEPIEIFFYIHTQTGGNPCQTGCTWFEGGTCPGYKRLENKSLSNETPRVSAKTNACIAKELHCSKRQVATMRKNGTLPENYR